MTSSDRKVWTTIFPESEAVAIKLREGVSPQEVVERVMRRYVLYPMNVQTFRSLEESVERELSKYGVHVEASVEKDSEAPHGVVVVLKRLR